MNRFLIIFFVSILLISNSYAQEQAGEKIVRNNVYLEILGNGFLYSINYERFFHPNFSLRSGVMFFTGTGESEDGQTARASLAIFPVMLNYLINFGNHHIEIGAGPELAYVSAYSDLFGKKAGFGIGGTARIGYVYFPTSGGFNFRIAYTPIVSEIFTHSFGIGVGYGF